MNPGPVEEAGKVAGGIVDALKGQPILLGLLLMNFALIALLYYVAHGVSETRHHEMTMLYENQKTVQEILSRCVVTEVKPR